MNTGLIETNLKAIDAEVEDNRSKVDANGSNEERYYWHLQNYVAAVLWYCSGAFHVGGLSFYRYYEDQIGMMIRAAEAVHAGEPWPVEAVEEAFYDSAEVKQVNEMLITICDDILPNRWREVYRQYRLVRAAAGYPTETTEERTD